MQMVNDSFSHKQFWKKYENTNSGQVTFFGSHSTRTDSLNNMPNGVILNLYTGSMAITSDAVAHIWDDFLGEWIPQ